MMLRWYMLDVAVTHAGTSFGRDAFAKWWRAGLAECPTCRAVLGCTRPPYLRALMRRLRWGYPLAVIRGDE